MSDVLSESVNVSWDDFRETKNRSEVFRFLENLGYNNIIKRTWQRHCKKGVVRTNEAGFFTKKLTRDYIKTNRLVSEREDINEPTFEVLVDKSLHEAKRVKYQAAREQIKYEREKKLVGSRTEFNLEMAARWASADNYLRGFGEQYAAELIALCGGNQDKRNDLSLFWTEKFDEAMRIFAKPLNYKVIFKDEE